MPLTPLARKVLELALREALSLRHAYVEPEHMLLALIRQSEGMAATILHKLGVRAQQVRDAVILGLAGVAGRQPGLQ